MPRSTKLKDDNAGQREGVHKLADCICCDKQNIRSDHYNTHFGSHVKKSVSKNAVEFSTEYDLDLVEDVLVKPVGGPDVDKIRYPYGVCYSCHRVVYNKDPRSLDDFCNHICKEKKEAVKKQQQEEKMKSPPDFKALWEKIGTNKMSEASRIRYDDMPELCSDEHGEEKYNLMISYFIGRVLGGEKAKASAPATGGGLMSLKKTPGLVERFQYDDNDNEIIGTILAVVKNEATLVDKYKKELASQEYTHNAEITAKDVLLFDTTTELKKTKDNALYYAEEARNAQIENERLKAMLNQQNTITHMD